MNPFQAPRSFPLGKLFLAGAAFAVTMSPMVASAAPTPEEISKSFSQNMDGEVNASTFLYVVGGALALILLLSLANRQWRKGTTTPKVLNHQGKLMREVLRSIPLRGREVKQLKALAEQVEAERPLASPLTLMLCPSVLAKTIQTKKPRGDRKAIIAVARKAGLKVNAS